VKHPPDHPTIMNGRDPYTLITGGAGFVGSNLANDLLRRGRRVVLLDALDRPGVGHNAAWLSQRHGDRVRLVRGDVRDAELVERLVARAEAVFHLAAQVAVTTSLRDPVADFEVNARGTLNLLEAMRKRDTPPPLVFTSTNKVYGDLAGLELEVHDDAYRPVDAGVATHGVGEAHLRFLSPYGCSKGAADQYVLDYAHTFGLPAVVFRMSCIYGPRQFGTEDQGWLAHFLIRAIADEPITIYGDGRQVRDVLFVDDLVRAMRLASERADDLAGRAFNLGGGPARAVTLLEVIDLIATLTGRQPDVQFDDWRPGDQRFYVSNTAAFEDATGWHACVGVEQGVRALYDWLCSQRQYRSNGRAPTPVIEGVPA
jgi:CDP-paratose 2-epimerase